MQLRYNREQLIDALEARRPWAKARDAKLIAAHRIAEKQYLVAFRAACRDALKWDYSIVRTERSVSVRNERGHHQYPPSCPALTEATLDKVLSVVRALRPGARLTIADKGTWSQAFWLLTQDDTIKAEAC